MDSLSLTDSFIDIKPDITFDTPPTTLDDHQGLPTPPFSPARHTHSLQPRNDVLSIANELIAHYQKESIWVHHTRASLELALTADGSDSFTAAKRALSQSPVKTEPDAPALPPPQRRNSRWMQRKQSFNLNLKLDGEPHPAAAALARRRRRASQTAHQSPAPESSTKLLELFSELVEARMESCARVSALARSVYSPPLDTCS